ncbi:hemocyte protein-glutamine gamma-glutamyltransferase-like [Babylonia areolata]|uniref:hemocyte protein-glutamine gamma-glutamyltransferase-like n=1 Tax=Babylonia areolata TaxID=304850 RepID=UPI003FD0CE63
MGRRGHRHRRHQSPDDSRGHRGHYYTVTSFFGSGGGHCYHGGRRPNIYNYGHVDYEYDQADGGEVDTSGSIVRPQKPDPSHKDVLQVEAVDFKVADNTRKHHTDEYDIAEGRFPKLVVRRGQPFNIQIDFSRAYDTKKDDLRLVFEIGENPKASKGTQVEFILSDKDEEGQWGAKVAQQSGKSLTLTVFTPPDCIVGKWRFKVGVVKRSDTQTAVYRYNHRDPIYMLFNPWCKEDTVYMEKADDLQAYVLKEEGKIYSGNSKNISPKPWVFGQFSGNVLDCCMYILELSELNFTARSNPILLVRKLTAMINSQDEGGVLTGNWSGNYRGGKSPLSWTGSAPILEQFYRDKSPVRFGQCWVFSGVLTTVCRALGLPARSVTNFASAHDVDTSITIDLHFDCSGQPLEDQDEDSIWNFHVWNEVWMARPDLPAGYGGWQACDATPQETSEGVYCCGPCPVRAIKEGEVNMPYDGTFIFAEVNADRVYWLQQEDGSWQNVYAELKTVGRFISTLSKNDNSPDPREDVTNQYKYPEDSPEERVAVRKANMVGSKRKDVYKCGPQDVKFELRFDSEHAQVGEEFQLDLVCHNTSKDPRTVQGQISVSTMYYTGVVASQVAKQNIDGLVLKPGERKAVSVKVSPDTYHSKLKDCCMLSLSAMARVKETKQIFTKKDDTRLTKPGLNIKAPSSGKKEQEFEVEVSFTNPLTKTLTNCVLEVEGPGLGSAKLFPQGDVPPKGTFFTTIKLKPKKKGKKEIVAIFNTSELEDINGSHTFTVQA